jgi:hypothetical protein
MKWVVMLAACAACARFDLDSPIALAPDPSWSEHDVATLAAAASCWRHAFGIPFVVDRASTEDQQVIVRYNDLACESAGHYTPGLVATIDVCPLVLHQPGYNFPLFTTLLHELGHASGIRSEGKGRLSAMGQAFQGNDASSFVFPSFTTALAFSDEDVEMLSAETSPPGGDCAGRMLLETDDASDLACFCLLDACPPDAFEPDLGRRLLLAPGTLTRSLCGSRSTSDLDIDRFVAPVVGTVMVTARGLPSETIIVKTGTASLPVGRPFAVTDGMEIAVTAGQVKQFPLTYTIELVPGLPATDGRAKQNP